MTRTLWLAAAAVAALTGWTALLERALATLCPCGTCGSPR